MSSMTACGPNTANSHRAMCDAQLCAVWDNNGESVVEKDVMLRVAGRTKLWEFNEQSQSNPDSNSPKLCKSQLSIDATRFESIKLLLNSTVD